MTRVWVLALMAALVPVPALAQESRLAAETRVEVEHVKEDCQSFKTLHSCVATLVTDHPFHIAIGSLAPQNGFGAGPAVVMHFTPTNWRNVWSGDAVLATSGGWRAGSYFKAIRTRIEPPRPATGGTERPRPIRIGTYPIFAAYVQATSLPRMHFYGTGPDSSLSNKTSFGLREAIVGGSARLPISRLRWVDVSLLGEGNVRRFELRPGTQPGVTSIENRFTESTAPSLDAEPSFLQLGEGASFETQAFNDRLQLHYKVQFQQFIAAQSTYSFGRWSVNLDHEIPIYFTNAPPRRRDTNSPNECAKSPTDRSCPGITRDRWGSIQIGVWVSKSVVSNTSVVPFYLQRTLGGSDIDGNPALASYDDYRFSGPHLLLLRQAIEHAVWGPVGVLVQLEEGKVASQHEGLNLKHLRHSTTVGMTVRAGGFPMLRATWSTGGPEGRHVAVTMDTSLLGGGGRPALQ